MKSLALCLPSSRRIDIPDSLNRTIQRDLSRQLLLEEGRPVFKDLLFRKSTCIFVAFDLLYLNGKDLRTLTAR